jgi:hypothetical protein
VKGASFPLVIFVVLALGVLVEIVEGQDRRAAYALVVILLLGMITFNAAQFQTQMKALISSLAAPSKQSLGNPAAQPGYGRR